MPVPTNPNVLVGVATSDDAGIYRLSSDLALVQTVDFSTPVVDDPYDFGRIAAANALSDVYAMGGTPITALNVVAFPIDELHHDILRRILEGGAAIAVEAGVAIIGGHTIKGDEPTYGMAVTGTIHPERIISNALARPGDLLLLTKPIGAGILTTARTRDAINAAALDPVIAEMTRLNAAARDAMLAHGAHACTDISGFGLVGHAVEMARASHVGIEIDAAQVPLFAGVLDLIERDIIPSGTEDNLVHHGAFTSYADYVVEPLRIALSDAMSSGGVLISAAPANARAILAALAPTHRAAMIGRVTEDGDGTISVM